MRKILAASFAVSFAVWTFCTWPLLTHIGSGIPSSASNIEKGHFRNMIAGDHLQILYHFWLFKDAVFGPTPLFSNPYEFRMSDDPPDRAIRSYFLPFSIIFALIEPIGGRALAWNITGLFSVWISCLALWLLVRRYNFPDIVAAFVSIIGLLLPYRWHALMGGSPTGLAICLVPAIVFGLDAAVRNERKFGAVVAGLGLIAAALSDRHVFFFSALLCPLWIFISMLAGFCVDGNRFFRSGVLKSLLPLPLLFGLAYAALKLTSRHVDDSIMASGRSLGEVALFSRTWDGLFVPKTILNAEIFIGLIIPVSFLFLFMAVLFVGITKNRKLLIKSLPMILLAIAVVMVAILALGVNGPYNGKIFILCRKWIPKYDMIRQPAKIFCVIPTILPLLLLFSILPFWEKIQPRRYFLAAAVFIALLFVEYRQKINPTICLISKEQAAYAAAAKETAGRQQHAVIVPFWPGDSHWSSLYQHYVSLYRMPMVNGYSPAVPRRYANDVYPSVSTLNRGFLTQSTLQILEQMGVTRLLLHENAFPEKVSPFPSCHTLKRFLANPSLNFIAASDGIWAFEVSYSDSNKSERRQFAVPDWSVYCPARRWRAVQGTGVDVEIVSNSKERRDSFLRMASKSSCISFPETRAVFEPNMRIMLRLKGQGKGMLLLLLDGKETARFPFMVDSDKWSWFEFPSPPFDGQAILQSAVKMEDGLIDVDYAILAAGSWHNPELERPVIIPAPCFFHFGETDIASNTVQLKQKNIASFEAIYGPCMPLEPGFYRFEMKYSTPAESGIRLGSLALRDSGCNFEESNVISGKPALIDLKISENKPVSVYFLFGWTADVIVKEFVISRMDHGD